MAISVRIFFVTLCLLMVHLMLNARENDTVRIFLSNGQYISKIQNLNEIEYSNPLVLQFSQDLADSTITFFNDARGERSVGIIVLPRDTSSQAKGRFLARVNDGVVEYGYARFKLDDFRFFFAINNGKPHGPYKMSNPLVLPPKELKRYQRVSVLGDALYMAEKFRREKYQNVALILREYYGITAKNIEQNAFLNDAFTNLYPLMDAKKNTQEKILTKHALLTPYYSPSTGSSQPVVFSAPAFTQPPSLPADDIKKLIAAIQYDFDSLADLSALFPATSTEVYASGSTFFNINVLRSAYSRDMNSLIDRLGLLVSNHEKLLANNTDQKTLFNAALHLSRNVLAGYHPGTGLNSLNNYQSNNALRLISLINASFMSGNDSCFWYSREIINLANDDLVLKIYLGLLAQDAQKKGIAFPDKSTMLKHFNSAHHSFEAYKSTIKLSFVNIAHCLTSVSLRVDQGKGITLSPGMNIETIGADLLALSAQLSELFAHLPSAVCNHDIDDDLELTARGFSYFTRLMASLWIDARKGQYASANTSLIAIYDSLMGITYHWQSLSKDNELELKKKLKTIPDEDFTKIKKTGKIENTLLKGMKFQDIAALQRLVADVHAQYLFEQRGGEKDARSAFMRLLLLMN